MPRAKHERDELGVIVTVDLVAIMGALTAIETSGVNNSASRVTWVKFREPRCHTADKRGRVKLPARNSARLLLATTWIVAWLSNPSGAFGANDFGSVATEHQTKSAAGSKDPVELRWVRLEGAEQCPPKTTFESALEKRLGRASFSDRGSRVLTVSLSNEKGPFRAVLSLKDRASDAVESKQELFSYSSQCDEVFAATVLSVALLLNPDEMEDPYSGREEEDDSGFFDPPSADVGLAVPRETMPSRAAVNPDPTYEIPVAPRPWARTHGTIIGSLGVGIEQLPGPAVVLSARTEWPVARAWLLWVSGDWLQSGPAPEVGTGVTVVLTSGWAGGSWLPYEDEILEIHLLGGLGVRQLTATLTGADPRHHLAMQLGVGMVVQVTEHFALDGRAAAIVPLRAEFVGNSWTQPAIGGQLQLGISVGIPNPADPN